MTMTDDRFESDVKFQQLFACGGGWVGGRWCVLYHQSRQHNFLIQQFQKTVLLLARQH